MKKESERVVNSWKMKNGKNRKLELGRVAQGWDRTWKEMEKGQHEETGLTGELHYRMIFGRRENLGKRARIGWKRPHNSVW